MVSFGYLLISTKSVNLSGCVPFYTVRCPLLHRAVVFGPFSPNLTALSGFLCTNFLPIKEWYLMSNVPHRTLGLACVEEFRSSSSSDCF